LSVRCKWPFFGFPGHPLPIQEKIYQRKSFTGHVKANLAIYNEKNNRSQYKIVSCLVILKARKFTFGFKRLELPKEKAEVFGAQQTPVDSQKLPCLTRERPYKHGDRRTLLGFVESRALAISRQSNASTEFPTDV
jgi:hypothetical protein